MNLKTLIQEYKSKTGYSDSDIAKQCNVSRSTVMRWSKGEIQRVSTETMNKLSEMFGYNIEPILKGLDSSLHLPILGYVKAGYDLFAQENYIGEEEVSLEEKNGDYFLKVTGNSMVGVGIMDGSYVLVQQTSTIKNHEIGVVMIADEVTVKRIIFKKNLLILEAANPDASTRYFTPDEVHSLPIRIIGKVLSVKTFL